MSTRDRIDPVTGKIVEIAIATVIDLNAQIKALAEALIECADAYEDAAGYKGDYLREKHDDVHRASAFRGQARAALTATSLPRSPERISPPHELGYALTCAEKERDAAIARAEAAEKERDEARATKDMHKERQQQEIARRAAVEARAATWARAITRGCEEPHALHLACAMCRPAGRNVIPGFRCAFHEALAYLQSGEVGA